MIPSKWINSIEFKLRIFSRSECIGSCTVVNLPRKWRGGCWVSPSIQFKWGNWIPSFSARLTLTKRSDGCTDLSTPTSPIVVVFQLSVRGRGVSVWSPTDNLGQPTRDRQGTRKRLTSLITLPKFNYCKFLIRFITHGQSLLFPPIMKYSIHLQNRTPFPVYIISCSRIEMVLLFLMI